MVCSEVNSRLTECGSITKLEPPSTIVTRFANVVICEFKVSIVYVFAEVSGQVYGCTVSGSIVEVSVDYIIYYVCVTDSEQFRQCRSMELNRTVMLFNSPPPLAVVALNVALM